MPTSDAQGKPIALDWIRRINPTTVVDVGAGDGTYRRLVRDAGDPINAEWTAVEVWQPYVDEYCLGELYDQVVVADARHLTWLAYQADLVILGDVLEHMTHADARTLLRRAMQGAANLIVSIPVLHLAQGPVNGNPYEAHVDHWTASLMRRELDQTVDLTQGGAGQVVSTLVETWEGDVLFYGWWRNPHH